MDGAQETSEPLATWTDMTRQWVDRQLWDTNGAATGESTTMPLCLAWHESASGLQMVR